MAIERHQELIMDYAGKTGKENFLFVFISGGIWGVQVNMFKKWEKESAKHQERKLAAGK
jgi:hypothetical protein